MLSGGNLFDVETTRQINIAKFYLACREGNKDLVKNLINAGLDVNVTNENGDTGLIYASLKGQDSIVEFLIEKGANLDKQDKYGNTALMYACGKGHKNIAKLLIDNGADANIRNNRDETAIIKACFCNQKNIVYFLLRNVPNLDIRNIKLLIWACGNGYTKIVEELLRIGIDKNEVYTDNDVPLFMASSGRIPRIARLSLEHTNDFVSINKWVPINGDTPLLMACVGGYTDIVRILLSNNANVDMQNENNNSPLLIACIGGHKKIVELLLEKGANPNVRNLSGWVPLICASYSGRHSIVELLLKHGADVDTIDSTGNTALMFACDKSNEKVVNLLLNYNATVDMIDEEGDTALIRACMENNENIVGMLLKHLKKVQNNRNEFIAFVNSQNTLRQTALMWASDIGNISIISGLINFGARLDLEDIKGDTAFMWACSAGNFDAAKFLLKSNANINDLAKKDLHNKTFLIRLCELCRSTEFFNWLLEQYCIQNNEAALKELINEADNNRLTALMYACNENFLELAKLLLEKGANVKAKDINGNTSLHMVCHMDGTTNIISLLLNHGINIDVENSNGNTPTHMACGNNLINKTKFLIRCGANLNKVDLQGDNALHVACIYQSTDIVPILIKEGMDVNIQNNLGKTPLIMACNRENEDIARMLIRARANVNCCDKNGNTPLSIVCFRNNISMGNLLILNFANLYSLSEIEKEQREKYIKNLKRTPNLKIKIRIALYQKDLTKLREYLNEYFCKLNITKNESESIEEYTYRLTITNIAKIDDLKEFIYALNGSAEINKLKQDNKEIRDISNKLRNDPLRNVPDRSYELHLNESLIQEVALFKDIINETSKRNIVDIVFCVNKELKNKNSINCIPKETTMYLEKDANINTTSNIGMQ